MSLFDLKEKVAVITGGSGVLGGTIANSFAKAGVRIVILDRSQATIDKTVAQIHKDGGQAIGFETNVLDKASLIKNREAIIKAYGRIDILLNVAGGNMPGATINPDQTIFDLKMEDFQKVTDLNLNGTVLPSLVFGEVMAAQKQGSIVNYSSMAVDRAITRVVGYSASKAAMENFTRWMAVEMANKFGEKIRVNAIAPGFFVGNQNRALLIKEDGTFTERGTTIIKNTPMNRFGKADELNGVIQFLCSDAASFVTGAVIPVDGGFSIFSGV